jgi:V8-like Glu-specific endopeptidase
VRGGEVSIDDPQIGNWAPLLAGNPTLKPALESVGRVDLDGQHAGSGFVVAPGILMTNRHVLEVLAEEFRGGADSSVWEFSGRPSVNFDDLGRGTAKRFAITDVIFAGPDRIDDTVDFRHLDVALLAVETRNAVGQDLPKPLTWLDDVGLLTKGTQIIVAGYPARPGTDSLRDPATGAVRRDVIKRLQEMFGFDYSTKYLSPGEIDFEPGKLTGDDEAWAIAHDATTLGGSSGSWVMHLGEPFGVLGLHFGGGTLRANFAHALSRIAPRLPKLPN